jgi:hypothetical protein
MASTQPHTGEPPIVANGVLTRREYEYVLDGAESGDADEYAARLQTVCLGNYPAFSTLFMNRLPLKHLVDIRKESEGYNKHVLQIARFFGKSISHAVDEPIHDICYSLVPGSGYEDIQILIVQESKDQALKTISAVQDGLRNTPLITKAFLEPLGMSDFKKEAAKKWNENTIQLHRSSAAKDYTLHGIGVGNAVLGGHPDKLIADDLESDKDRTPVPREAKWKWYTTTILGMLGPEASMTYIGTPKFHGGLLNRLSESGKYHVTKLPGMSYVPQLGRDFEKVEDAKGVTVGVRLTDHGAANLVSPWPCPAGRCEWWKDPQAHFDQYGEHRSPEWMIYNVMLEDYVAFCGEIMLMLVGGDETRIQPSMLRFFSHVPNDIGKKPNDVWTGGDWDFADHEIVPFLNGGEVIRAAHGWDHAIGMKRTHDETAMARAYRTNRGEVHFKVHGGHWHYRDVWEKMVTYALTDDVREPDTIVSEAITFQEIFGSEAQADERIPPDKVEMVKVHTDKDTALVDSGIINLMISGKVYFDIRDKETINQLLTFTAGAKDLPDDRVDAIRLAYGAVRKPRTTRAGILSSSKRKLPRLRGGIRGSQRTQRRLRGPHY